MAFEAAGRGGRRGGGAGYAGAQGGPSPKQGACPWRRGRRRLRRRLPRRDLLRDPAAGNTRAQRTCRRRAAADSLSQQPGSSALGSLAGNRDCLRHPRLALPGIITVGLAQPACPRQPEARCQTLALRHGTGELNGIFHEMTRVSHSNIKAMF